MPDAGVATGKMQDTSAGPQVQLVDKKA